MPALVTTRGAWFGLFMYQSMSALLHPGVTITYMNFGVEYIQPSMEVSGELHIFPSPALVPLVLSRFLVEQVTILFIKDLITDVSVGWVLQGLPLLHLTVWLPRHMLHR